ncbi:MAG: SRPBCC family protein [Devosia sp.]|jgi:uncharacterized protein YndB with AHSA1/START domain
MAESRFVYVTYIRTTPQKLWEALTTTEFMKAYLFGFTFDTNWKKGSPWRMVQPKGAVTDAGEILAIEPPRRLELSWRHEDDPEAKAEGYGRCLFEVAPAGEASRLTVTHTMPVENSRTIAMISEGWPQILSNLKSLLETGKTAM